MEFITSRSFALPESEEDLRQGYWFNLWRTRRWPYRELMSGDALYWHDTPSQCIVWKTRATNVERFPYDTKAAVLDRLEKAFGSPLDTNQPYFAHASETGFCLTYTVGPVERLCLRKPEGLRFPQLGWICCSRTSDPNPLHIWRPEAGWQQYPC